MGRSLPRARGRAGRTVSDGRREMKIGLRIPGRARDLAFDEFCAWCVNTGFQAVDVGRVTPEITQAIRGAGLEIGTADLPGTGDMLSPEPAKREAGIAAATEAIQQAAAHAV